MATALAKSKRTPLQFRYIYDRITVSRRINQGESSRVGSGFSFDFIWWIRVRESCQLVYRWMESNQHTYLPELTPENLFTVYICIPCVKCANAKEVHHSGIKKKKKKGILTHALCTTNCAPIQTATATRNSITWYINSQLVLVPVDACPGPRMHITSELFYILVYGNSWKTQVRNCWKVKKIIICSKL